MNTIHIGDVLYLYMPDCSIPAAGPQDIDNYGSLKHKELLGLVLSKLKY